MARSKRRYFKELRFRQVRALVELGRHGGFAGAARQLRLSVTSVWQQIRALEDEFRVRLVAVRGGKVELTDDGRTLAELATPLVESFDSLRMAFAERQRGLQRELALATTTSLLMHDLPPVVAEYRQAHPDVRITFIEQPSREARATFEQGRADLAIVGEPVLRSDNPHYHAEPVTSYTTHLVCPPGHALLKARRLTPAQIARHPLILPVVGGSLRERAVAVFAEAGIHDLDIVMSANNLSLVVGYVRMGYGVGLLSLSPVAVAQWPRNDEHALELRDVSRLFGCESVMMIHRATGHEMSHVREFRETVRRCLPAKAVTGAR